jgi:hypothetical protein
MKNILSLIFLFSLLNGYAQTKEKFLNQCDLRVKAGVGLARFQITNYYTENYLTSSFRTGVDITKNVFKDKFQVESGFNFYLRTKTTPFLIDHGPGRNYYYGKGGLLHLLEETAIQHHFALEIPLSLRYFLNHGKSVSLGLILREWLPKKNVDLLSSQTELALTGSIYQKLLWNLSLGLELHMGLKDLYPILNVGSGDIIVRSQAATIILAYDL